MYKLWIVEKDLIKEFNSQNELDKFVRTACTLDSNIIVHRIDTYVFVMKARG